MGTDMDNQVTTASLYRIDLISVIFGMGGWGYFITLFFDVFEFTWTHLYTGMLLCLASILLSILLIVRRELLSTKWVYIGLMLNISYFMVYPLFIYLTMYAAV